MRDKAVFWKSKTSPMIKRGYSLKQAIIGVRRVYDTSRSDDGTCYLIDRFWPRAVKKKDLRIPA